MSYDFLEENGCFEVDYDIKFNPDEDVTVKHVTGNLYWVVEQQTIVRAVCASFAILFPDEVIVRGVSSFNEASDLCADLD